MTPYPIFVSKKSIRNPRSASGGKDYHCVLIYNVEGDALTIFRYGKKDTWGTGFDVERHTDRSSATLRYTNKIREKQDKGYREELLHKDHIRCDDEESLRKELGVQYWAKLGPDHLSFIAPGCDTTGSRAVESVEFNQTKSGRWEPKEKKPKPMPEEVESIEDRVKSNPLYGSF